MYIEDVNASKTDIVGFKTIRFFQDSKTLEDEARMIAWLRINFPCMRVIVNINSNTTQYAASVQKAWTLNTKETASIQGLLKLNEQATRMAKTLGPKVAFLLDKNEWSNNISKLNEVVTWLGFHPSCHFKDLMEFNTKGKGYGNGNTALPKFDSKCKRLDWS